MADQKISQLTELTNPNSNDFIPIVSGGETKKITVSNLAVAGSSGTSGTSGVNGTNGSSGTSGSNGSSGTSGSNGSSGTSGSSGSSGLVNYTGLITTGSISTTQNITGSLVVSGSATFNVSALVVSGRAGDEGGEINLAIPVTNTSLENRVNVDVWQNRFRIFEGSANAKGVFIDLNKAPTGVSGELMHKASGFVNAGDYVQLGNLKARIPTSGNRSLQLATVSGTYGVVGSNVFSAAGTAGTSITSPLSITTTPGYLNAGLHFIAVGYTDTWIIMDYTAFIAWRITMVIGPSYNANLITIERLY